MKALTAIAISVPLFVAGCQTPIFTQEQAGYIRAASLGACTQIDRVHEGYNILVAGGQVSERVQIKGTAAFQTADAFCDSAAQLEPESAIATAALLFLRVSQIYKEAKASG